MNPSVFSVIVPHFQDEERGLRAVKSLCDQHFDRDQYEVLLVDDGSPLTDEAKLTLKKMPSVRVVEKAHSGAGRTRNAGIETALGKFVIFMDQDCVAHNDLLHAYFIFLKVHPECAAVGGQTLPMESSRGLVSDYCAYRDHLRFPIRDNAGTITSIITANACFRKDVLLRVGGFSSELDALQNSLGGEDSDLSYRLLKAGFHLYYCEHAKVSHEHRHTLRGFMKQQVRNARGLSLHAWLRGRPLSDVGLPEPKLNAFLKHFFGFVVYSRPDCPSLCNRTITYWRDGNLTLISKIVFPLLDLVRRSSHYVGVLRAARIWHDRTVISSHEESLTSC